MMSTPSPSRLGKISEEQKTALIEYMSSHEQLRSGKFTAIFTHKKAQEYWQELTDILNSIPGARKDWHQWRKTWQDMRTKTKSKSAAIRKYREGTGGGAPMKEILTPTEGKILEMMCPTSLEGHQNIEESIIVFESSTSDTNNEVASTSVAHIVEDVEIIEVAEKENTPPSLPVPPTKVKGGRKNLTQSVQATKQFVNVGSERNAIMKHYNDGKLELRKQELQLKKQELQLKEREVAVREREALLREREIVLMDRGVSALERIAASVENVLDIHNNN